MGKGGSAPEQDPNIGIAALKSAEVGEDYLSFMKDQAAITNRWAEDDRARYEQTFRPVEDQFIADALEKKSPEYTGQRVSEAQADVRLASASGQAQQKRQLAAYGVKPGSGRYVDETRRAETAEALQVAGAGNIARRQVEAEADAAQAAVVNLGNGSAVNPAQSIGISNGAISAGATGAMQGYGQQSSILNNQYQNEVGRYQADQAATGSLFGALGTVAGAAFFSSKEMKEDMSEATGVLDAVREMPVEKWRYKDGTGQDSDPHIGTYAEDFQAQTGLGDGKSIKVQDAIGVTMGAVKELDAKVQKLVDNIGVSDVMKTAA